MNDNLHISPNEREETSSENRNSGSKGLIDYTLIPYNDAVVFQLNSVSDSVLDFLKKVGEFHTSSGYVIKYGNLFPEWKESLNTIYLTNIGIGKVDVTRFPDSGSKTVNKIMNNKVHLFKAAIHELIDAVKFAGVDSLPSVKVVEKEGKITLS